MIEGKLTDLDRVLIHEMSQTQIERSAEPITEAIKTFRVKYHDGFVREASDAPPVNRFRLVVSLAYVDERPSKIFDDPELLTTQRKNHVISGKLVDLLGSPQAIADMIVEGQREIMPTTLLSVHAWLGDAN